MYQQLYRAQHIVVALFLVPILLRARLSTFDHPRCRAMMGRIRPQQFSRRSEQFEALFPVQYCDVLFGVIPKHSQQPFAHGQIRGVISHESRERSERGSKERGYCAAAAAAAVYIPPSGSPTAPGGPTRDGSADSARPTTSRPPVRPAEDRGRGRGRGRGRPGERAVDSSSRRRARAEERGHDAGGVQRTRRGAEVDVGRHGHDD
mmetsp:Transcript_35937/g.107373  ORF Transcript_35937/g.107373 Transcript_35937/m.107373 type:complete len:205 (-) Transcript_35937:863-1477(-)